jgi:hypothetical protein
MRKTETNNRFRPGLLTLLAGVCLVVAIFAWATRPKPAAPGANPEIATLPATPTDPTPASPPDEQVQVKASPESTLASPSPNAGQSAPGAATGLAAQPPEQRPVPILLEEAKVYEAAARALSHLANPEMGDPAGPMGSPQVGSPQVNPGGAGTQPITNGVQAYRERDRLLRERVQEMRALRAAAIAEARRANPKNP